MNEETLFQEALSRSPPERAAFLAQACAGRSELRASIEALLGAHEKSSNILDAPPDDARGLATGDFTPESGHGQPGTNGYRSTIEPGLVIAGRYTLVELIGEGGMGEVWVAKQSEPVKRKVAIKLIKTGMDSKAVLARFEQERQALALMDHPNIARVLDGGMTPTGQPFFVMDLVNGLSLTKFCDEAKLTLQQRLELFVPICQAVQHAHQKGIVHRDLKPANILVTMIDAKPVPKIIDFGVAKATSGRLTDESLSTHFGAVVGTLEYMSPEQAGYSGDDVDTRADIYSLGVLLYELLTGLRPFDAKRLRKTALTEMIRIIKEEEPSKPSTRLSTDESLASSAALRHIEPKKLMALLRGDLDWVVMKCLEKQRERRYETANALARDIQRYLNDEPVEACPPSVTYRFKKFAKKNRTALTTAATIAFLLVAGAGVSIWQAVRANRAASAERQAKLDAEEKATAEKTARQEAVRQQKFAEGIAQFVCQDFLALTSVEGQDRFGGEGKEALSKDTTLQQLLDRAAQKLRTRKDLDPQIEAELCWIIGVNFRASGEAKKAVEFLERALKLRSDVLGRDHEDTINAMNSLGVAYGSAGYPDKGLRLIEEAFKLHRAKMGPDHPNTIMCMVNLALSHRDAGTLEAAIPIQEEALKHSQEKLGPEHSTTLTAMSNLARTYQLAGKLNQALALREKTVLLQKKKLGPDHYLTLDGMRALAETHYEMGKFDLALTLYEEAVKLQKAKLGPDDPDTLNCMNSLVTAYLKMGKPTLAVPLAEEVLKVRQAKLDADHPDVICSRHNLAEAYRESGRLDLALPQTEETLKLLKAKFGAGHPELAFTMNALAGIYDAAGKRDLALPLWEESFKLQKIKFGPDHPVTLGTMNNLAVTYRSMGKLDLAIPLLEEGLKRQRTKLGPDHPDTLVTMANLADAHRANGKISVALELLEEVVKRSKANLGPDDPNTTRLTGVLAAAYWSAKQLDKSIPLFEDALKRQMVSPGPTHSDTMKTIANLGVNYRDAGRIDEAIPLLEKAHQAAKKNGDWQSIGPDLFKAYQIAGKWNLAAPILEEAFADRKAKLGPDHPTTLTMMNNLATTYYSAKQLDKSIPLFEETLKIQEAKFGRDNRNTLWIIANLGVNYRDGGRLHEAISLLEEVYQAREKYPEFRVKGLDLLAAYAMASENAKLTHLLPELMAESRKVSPNQIPKMADALAQICQGLSEMKKWVEVEPLLRECLAIREKSLPDDWRTFNTMSALGGALLGQKKYSDAEPLLLKGYEGMKRREKTIPPQGKIRIPEAVERLVQLYESLDNKDEAAKWRAEWDAAKKSAETKPPPPENNPK
jgi:serine/threonine protein kinase